MIPANNNKITVITRRDIVDWLALREAPFHGRLELIDFLKRVWDLESMPSTDGRFNNLEMDIWQHRVNFHDWNDSELLTTHLDLLDCPDTQFCKFLETVLHPLAQSRTEEAYETAAKLNSHLEHDGFRLVEVDRISGRPIWSSESFVGPPGSEGTRYEIVLSFAGEQRDYVEAVAAGLRCASVSLFYDKYEEATLWGRRSGEGALGKEAERTSRYGLSWNGAILRDVCFEGIREQGLDDGRAA